MKAGSTLLDKPKAAKGSAPGQYLGFSLQEVRLFFHLLDCESEAMVGIEHVDDVSTQNEDGTCILEQCKSALSSNPISDAAVDLWKTFSNWAANVEGGFIDPTKSIFRLYVTPVKSGKLVIRMNEANSVDDIQSILAELKIKSTSKKQRLCDTYLKRFLSLGEEQCALIIKNFELISDNADPFVPIRKRLDPTIRPSLATEAIRWGIGLAKEEADNLIRRGQPPLIYASVFRKKFRAFLTAHDNTRFLYSLTDEPTNEMVSDLLEEAPVFIKQLDLVGVDINLKTRAAGDYLWASSDKTRWAEEGFVFEHSLDKYDDGLIRRHSLISAELSITQKEKVDKDRGQLLYLECCKGPSEKLQDLAVPGHFLTGSLNDLANRRKIGWHPSFKSLLLEDD